MTETVPLLENRLKVTTGIAGFDMMTGGGLPRGRVAAAIGGAGAGKTVFAMQALVHRVHEEGRIGVIVSFEQSPTSLISDLLSFDWGVEALIDAGKLQVIDGRPQADILLSGNFDIAGLLATVDGATDPDRPACVVLDGIGHIAHDARVARGAAR